QRGTPLDCSATAVDPAQRVSEALFRRGDGLAALRSAPHAAVPGAADRLRGVRADPAAAEVAARYRHAGGDHRGVLRAALRRWVEPRTGRDRPGAVRRG